MKYIPSVAFSICDHSPEADFTPLADYVKSITRHVLQEGLPKGVCLNVNFPVVPDGFKGVKANEVNGLQGKNRYTVTHGTYYY